MLDNSSFAPPPGPNAYSPGSGTGKSSLALTGRSSDELSARRRQRDLAASRIAGAQKTLVTTEQLLACGIGEGAISYRLGAGRLHVVFRGVYSMGCGELPPLALELAALLACGPGSFVSHESAIFAWGLRKTPPARGTA